MLKKHANILLGTSYCGHVYVQRYLKSDNPSQHKVIQGTIVTKSALVHEI